jgi:hypothetical protein
MSLRRTVRQTHRSGKNVYAVVEDIRFGYATVRLGSAIGPRLTSLPVLGGAVAIGETVIVDYSSGTPPAVRPVTVGAPIPAGLDTDDLVRPENTIDTDVSISLYRTSNQAIAQGSWETIEWEAQKFDTHDFFDTNEPDCITIPYNGFYMFIAHIGLEGWIDIADLLDGDDYYSGAATGNSRRAYIQFTSDVHGDFGMTEVIGLDTARDYGGYTTGELVAFLEGTQGEKVYFQILNSTGAPLTAIATGDYCTRLMGHRISRGGRADEGTGSAVEPFDDSDVEILTNEGYLHVSTITGAYARAIANATDTSNLDLTLDFRFWDTDNGANFRVFLRASRNWYDWQTPTKAYELVIANTGSWQINRIESGSRTQIGSYTTSPTTVQQKLHFQCSSTDIRASVWLDGESEPSWQQNIDDSTNGFTTAGTLQLGLFQVTGDHKMDIDNVDLDAP